LVFSIAYWQVCDLIEIILSGGDIIQLLKTLVLVICMANVAKAEYRPDEGEPLHPQELSRATDELIKTLQATHYFDFVDSRIHGWPESDSRYPWWGTFWSGVNITKENGQVTYTHGSAGADNNGIRTPPYMESACFAYVLSGNKAYAHLARRMMRGMSYWVLSSATHKDDLAPKVLNRSFYPVSVRSQDRGRDIYFNFEAPRAAPIDKSTNFVHLPNNPFFGDIHIQNDRSCDDIGQMVRGMTLTQVACRELLDEESKADFQQADDLYARWAADVDANKFIMPIIDRQGNYLPNGPYNSKAYSHWLFGFNPMCVGTLAIRLLHRDDLGWMKCGEGISILERALTPFLKNNPIEVVRSHHEAAVAITKRRGLAKQAEALTRGLTKRMVRDLGYLLNNTAPKKMNLEDIHMLLISAANVGVSLTSKEIRWLHSRLHRAYEFYTANANAPVFHVFDPQTGDGTYSYEPPEVDGGIYFRGLGQLLGACASPYRSTERPILDCEKLAKAFQR
jgi:hypothetical protein